VSNNAITVREAEAPGRAAWLTGATSAEAWKNPGSDPLASGTALVGFGAAGAGFRYVNTVSVSAFAGSSEYWTLKSSANATFVPLNVPVTLVGVYRTICRGYARLTTRKSRIAWAEARLKEIVNRPADWAL